MIELEDLLFSIFEDLRRQRVPLGMSDYLVALRAVNELTDGGTYRRYWGYMSFVLGKIF